MLMSHDLDDEKWGSSGSLMDWKPDDDDDDPKLGIICLVWAYSLV